MYTPEYTERSGNRILHLYPADYLSNLAETIGRTSTNLYLAARVKTGHGGFKLP